MKLILTFLMGALSLAGHAQTPTATPDSAAIQRQHRRAVALRIAVPSALVGVGVLAHSPRFNQTMYQAKLDMQAETQETFGTLNAHGVDDYTRHVPLAIAYGLMATGHHGARPAVSFTLIYLLAHELDEGVVSNLKRLSAEPRPYDPRDLTSFPSSHTSQAFLTATLLHEQYGRQYPLVSVAGYAVAAATGTMRVLGNKHWATDVLAGAGIGFLSAETVWHVYPSLVRLLPSKLSTKLLVVPTYSAGQGGGLAMALQL
nr:phosphatase PAP2 family protein [Hymenobacter cyanobacteriorum]